MQGPATLRTVLVAPARDVPTWAELFRAELPGHRILEAPDGGPVHYAVVGVPPPGLLRGLPGLELVLSVNAGVDGLLARGDVPDHLPIVRLVDPGLTEGMVEWVLAQVLAWHRNLSAYRERQGRGVWEPLPERLARERTVAVLGAGELGGAVTRHLVALGFRTRTWSRSGRAIEGAGAHAGPEGLAAAVAGADVAVCLLPLTPDTEGIVDAALLSRLAPGALLVNAGRGAQVVDADVIAALDGGQLSQASLDVFRQEPLPESHPFWRHPGVLVSPHVAAPSHARTAVGVMAGTVRRFERGEGLDNLVDRRLGY